MNKFLLAFLDLFRFMFLRLGIDYAQLRAIVEIKLTMDNRRQIISYNQKNKKDPGNTFLISLAFYALFGMFVSYAMYSIPSFVLSMVVFFSYIMVMVVMTLITDFSSILLDTSDNTIILPRPVDSRTLFAARLIHILLYLSQITLGLSLAPTIVVFLLYKGVVLTFFLIGIILAVFCALFITNAFYLLIMQFFNEEKLKNIINYFQIFMAVFIMGGYQILPRMMERIDMANFTFEIKLWYYLLPPAWMAGMMEAIHLNRFDTPHIILIALALSVPVAGTYLVNKYLTPIFSKKLGSLGGETQRKEKAKTEKHSLLENFSTWITSTPCERGAYNLIYKILGRDRKIKLKIYPAFGYVLIFGFIFLLRGREDLATTWANLPNTQYHLVLLYLTFMVIQVALYEIPYSDDFKASWIYFSAPINTPGEILSGTLKAIFIKLFLPAFMLISLFVIVVWGASGLDDIAFGILNNYLMLLLLAAISKRQLPLSMAPNVRGQAGNLMRGILIFMLIGILGAGHYLLTQFSYSFILLALIPLQLGAIYFLQRAYKKTSWREISL